MIDDDLLEDDIEDKKTKDKEPRQIRVNISTDVLKWKLRGLLNKTMDYIHEVHWQSDTYGSRIFFVLHDKEMEKLISANIHNRFLGIFRKYYKLTVLLDYDNYPDLLKRREAAEKARLKKEEKEKEEIKKTLDELSKKQAYDFKNKE